LRIEFAGALYHGISRGDEPRPVVRDDADRAKRLRSKPSLDPIGTEVARHFRCDVACRSPGRRSDDDARALAAYLARSRFGCRATAAAQRRGYGGPNRVSHAVRRIQGGAETLRTAADCLEARLS